MTDLDAYAEHCRRMATAQHRDDCATRPPGRMHQTRPDPACNGCVTDHERQQWAALADEAEGFTTDQEEALW